MRSKTKATIGLVLLSLFALGCDGTVSDADPTANGSSPQSLRDGEQATPSSLASTCAPGCPALSLTSPADFQVSQRDALDHASVAIKGTYVAGNSLIRVRAIASTGKAVYDSILTPQTVAGATSFSVNARLPAGGWYKLVVQEVSRDRQRLLSEGTVGHLGVGEVFIAAGQSNSGLSGETPQSSSPLASGAWLSPDGQIVWVNSVDYNVTTAGSQWPILANLLIERFRVPVGIMQLGCGGTKLQQWLPKDQGAVDASFCGADATYAGALYRRLVRGALALGSLRAVLWHQGESDAISGTSAADYQNWLGLIIAQVGRDTSKTSLPWLVANATYFPGSEIDPSTCKMLGAPYQYYSAMAPIRKAQRAMWGTGVVKAGPDTDGLYGSSFRYPGTSGACIHFSDLGLKVHGQLWYQKVLESQLIPGSTVSSLGSTVTLSRYASSRDHLITPGADDLSQYGYVFEGSPFRAFAQASSSQTYGLYRCLFNKAYHFLSIDPGCEGFQLEGKIGNVSATPLPGTLMVYRFLSPAPRYDFLSTVHLDEGLAAGYVLQGLQGFAPQ